MGRGRGRIFLYVLLVNMVLTDISITFDVSGFYLDLKWQDSGQEKKQNKKSVFDNSPTRMREQSFSFFGVTYC